ncbi:MAG: inositol monophosphatase [Spirochaetales bacterium]|nr:inositol monophosphatase [Spirochaetales bacterium]
MSRTEILEFPADDVYFRLKALGAILPEIGQKLLDFQKSLRAAEPGNAAGDLELMEEIDRHAEELLFARMRPEMPADEIISESSGRLSGSNEFLWYIDPVDGARNFLHGNPLFAISLGLCFRSEVVAGMVYVPGLSRLYAAIAGQGATQNGSPIFASTMADISRSLIATGLPYRRREILSELMSDISAFIAAGSGLRRTGSAVLDLCWVAEGTYDAFWESNLKPWDFCAASIIIREAGGKVTDFHGQLPAFEECDIVATNGKLHQPVIDLLARAADENLN